MNRRCDPEFGGFLEAGGWWLVGLPMSGSLVTFGNQVIPKKNAVHQVTASPKTSRLIQKLPCSERRLHPLAPFTLTFRGLMVPTSAGSENMGVSSPGFFGGFCQKPGGPPKSTTPIFLIL